jgi:hypothetical protein
MVNLRSHFKLAGAERQCLLTTKSAGYNNIATKQTTSMEPTHNTTAPNTMYCCWSQGAGPSSKYTNESCLAPVPVHLHQAKITNMLGGNNIIHRCCGEM